MPEQYLGWWQIRQPAGPATAAPKTKPLLPRPPPRRSGKRGARSARGASQRGPQASDWVQVESKDGARSFWYNKRTGCTQYSSPRGGAAVTETPRRDSGWPSSHSPPQTTPRRRAPRQRAQQSHRNRATGEQSRAVGAPPAGVAADMLQTGPYVPPSGPEDGDDPLQVQVMEGLAVLDDLRQQMDALAGPAQLGTEPLASSQLSEPQPEYGGAAPPRAAVWRRAHDRRLAEAVGYFGTADWERVAQHVARAHATADACQRRWGAIQQGATRSRAVRHEEMAMLEEIGAAHLVESGAREREQERLKEERERERDAQQGQAAPEPSADKGASKRARPTPREAAPHDSSPRKRQQHDLAVGAAQRGAALGESAAAAVGAGPAGDEALQMESAGHGGGGMCDLATLLERHGLEACSQLLSEHGFEDLCAAAPPRPAGRPN